MEEKQIVTEKPKAGCISVDDIAVCEASQNWLKYHSEPFSEVLVKWEFTHNYRRQLMEKMTIDEIFVAWPITKSPKYDALVN